MMMKGVTPKLFMPAGDSGDSEPRKVKTLVMSFVRNKISGRGKLRNNECCCFFGFSLFLFLIATFGLLEMSFVFLVWDGIFLC
jgi:hypothetical protein